MKKAFFGFFFLIVVSLGGYGYLFCYFQTGPESIVVVKEKSEGKVLKIYSQNRVFAYEGFLFWQYDASIYKVSFSDDFVAEVPVPELKGVKSVKSSIRVPVSLRYNLEKDTFDDLQLLDGNAERLKKMVRRKTTALLKSKIDPYVSPAYRGPQLKGLFKKILKEVEVELQDSVALFKIKLTALNGTSPAEIPGHRDYRQGIKYAAELRKLNFENRKALTKLKYLLKEQKLKEGALYDRYRQMAAIIKSNPEILKYIYIDKISDNLKVIISSDKHGVPVFLEEEKKEKAVKKTGEIDNLR